ncbi:MIZ zinc finger domain protein [Trichophyton benhamiae CBS 112371]|uniref:MIZ zinc finger domain protein n=1 Tax=Arthroderma benhamiae (strain ATCC MYA-4681 / CBS 112371) TaxID=663331 RepID=D4AVT9_ARTBC|nr:MIZ zinc finger domain protein [Trichophyton benhamiae CBS 112371]EFE32845.1 MIZ zinc finger domain protein [Trichophyton benhamiae CBS 112371]
MIPSNTRKQPASSIRQQANDSGLVASNSTASRFLGSRPKAWMQNASVSSPTSPITRRPSRPLPPANKPQPGRNLGPKDAICPSGNTNTNGDIPASKEPKDAVPTQCLSPVSPNMLPPALPVTPATVQQDQLVQQLVHPAQTVEQTTQALPSPSLSHGSHPAGDIPCANQVTADTEVPAVSVPPALGHHTAPPGQGSHAPQASRDSPQVDRSTIPQEHPLAEAAQPSEQDSEGQDKHQNKRPRLTTFQPPTTTSPSAAPITPVTPTTTTTTSTASIAAITTATATAPAPHVPVSLQPLSLTPLITGAGTNLPGNALPPLQQPPTDLSPQALNSCALFLDSIASRFQPTESTFIHMLRDACSSYDLHYLALHQLYCLSLKFHGSYPGIGNYATRGIQTVLGLISNSTKLSATFIEYFSAFPSDYPTIVSLNKQYAAAVSAIVSWAASLVNIWPPFFSNVINRGYPPLLDEIATSLGVHSNVMHGIFYSGCVSRLVANRAPGLRDAWKHILKKNIDSYRNRLKRANTQNPVTEAHIQNENRQLALMYQKIGEKYPPKGTPPVPVMQPAVPQQSVYHQQPSYNTHPMLQPLRSSHPLPPRPVPSHPTPGLIPSQQYSRFPSAATTGLQPFPQPLPPLFQQQPSTDIPSTATALTNPSPITIPAYAHGLHQPVTDSTATLTPIIPCFMPSYQAYPSPPVPPQPVGTPLFPPRNANSLPPANPSPNASVHLAHLRVVNVSLPKPGSQEPGENLFHSFESFAVSPTCLDWMQCNSQHTFNLSQSQHAALPRHLKPPNTCHITQGVFDGCKTYQIKCVHVTDTHSLTEEGWMATECTWPTAIYIHVNGHEHFLQRRFHFGKDLPVSINRVLKPGKNEVKITIIGPPEAYKKKFAIAVEVIDVASYKRTREAIQTLSQPQSLNLIFNRLTNNTINTDELSFVDDFITIPIIDPFMARIFDIPVRTVSCKHTECFDLNTFLDTRLSRVAKGPHGMAEDWKCPICNEDARPKRLLIDQFLIQVREELANRKQLDDVTAIRVRADKSWDVVMRQPSTGRTARGPLTREEEEATATTSATSNSPRATQAPPEIIELD